MVENILVRIFLKLIMLWCFLLWCVIFLIRLFLDSLNLNLNLKLSVIFWIENCYLLLINFVNFDEISDNL